MHASVLRVKHSPGARMVRDRGDRNMIGNWKTVMRDAVMLSPSLATAARVLIDLLWSVLITGMRYLIRYSPYRGIVPG